MEGKNAFWTLGIEPTDDTKTIKKAYAVLVKQYHPEEEPVEWKKIHDAYQVALRYAQNGKGAIQREDRSAFHTEPVRNFRPENTKKRSGVTDNVEEEEELEVLLRRIDAGTTTVRRNAPRTAIEREEQEKILTILRRIERKETANYLDWKPLFEHESYMMVRKYDDFLISLDKLLRKKNIPIPVGRRLLKEIKEIKMERCTNAFAEGDESRIVMTLEKGLEYLNGTYPKERSTLGIVGIALCVVLLPFFLYVFTEMVLLFG